MIEFVQNKMDTIFQDFQNNLELNPCYCQLKSFRFDGNNTPDYSQPLIQQYYLLKYLPAYLVEYYSIYNDVIDLEFITQNYNVLSIGCGCYLDLWGLAFATRENAPNVNIRYTGLDIIDWGYWDDLEIDAGFIQVDINEMETLDETGYNIIMFPKSIGEFSSETFDALKAAICNTTFTSPNIAIISSLRNTRVDDDINRFKELIDIFIELHKYKSDDDPNTYTYFTKKQNGCNRRIQDIVPGLIYPQHIKEYLINMYTNCQGYIEDYDWCTIDECSQLFSREPISTMSQVKYQIVRLER